MLLVSTTMYKRIRLLALVWFCTNSMAQAQTINSPYSRYGLGDIVPSQNILTRGMGGVSAAYYDFNTINFQNPASYGRLRSTTLDIGVELDNRTLRAIDPPRKFNAYSPTISYVQFGFPLKREGGWGVNVGLRPLTRVNYKIERPEKLPDVDSVHTLFEGSGGAYEAHLGTGFTLFKYLSVGVNIGYLFGSKNFSSRRSIVNDSVFHYMSNHETQANYGGLLFNAGIQYTIRFNKSTYLRLGAHGNLEHNFNASRDLNVETFQYSSGTGAPVQIDSVYSEKDVKGDVIYPASYGTGLIFEKTGKWMVGVDYNTTQWSNYRFFGESEPVQDSWTMHIGGQIFPSGKNKERYWNNVLYRGGFSIGEDYINADNKLPKWSVSLGASLPMVKAVYTNQFSVINVLLEYGQRGNKDNLIRENFFRIGVGLSLSDIWFLKRKFD